MRRFTAQTALEAWERGQGRDPVERPLALLAAALPEETSERLARLPLGRRDALLMRLRELSFGKSMKGFAQCPQCAARLEFPLDFSAYQLEDALEHAVPIQELAHDGYTVRFRVPDSRDLEAMSRCPDVETARRLLVTRCVQEAVHEGQEVAPATLPEPVLVALGERMETLDPLAYLPLAIDCARCGHAWEVLLDIGALLWKEISTGAERLLEEVQILAQVYGWSESEILAMSEARRRFYLSRASSPQGRGSPGGA